MAAELEGFEGKQLGGYRIRESIGRGGMAIVFRAEHLKSGEVVALKVMRPSLDTEPEFRARITREAKIAAKLRHPNIVRVRSIHEQEGYFFLVMDLIDGKSLFAVERSAGPMTVQQAAPLMKGILSALQFAHEQKVIHRDLKPENVLVTKEGQALLTDFGIAKPVEGTKLTKTGRAIGTPLYMSPEQVRGQADVDIRTDLYSTGVLFYELLCGRVPFDGDDPVAIGYSHVHQAPVFPSQYNPKLSPQEDLFVLKAMEKERADRFQTAEEMLRVLDDVYEGKPYDVQLRMTVRKLDEPGATGPLAKAGLVTLSAAALLVAGVYLQDGSLDRLVSLAGESSAGPAGTTTSASTSAEPDLGLVLGLVRDKRFDDVARRLQGDAGVAGWPRERQREVARALYEAALARMVSGDADGAIKLLGPSFQLDGERPDTAFLLGKAYLAMARYRPSSGYFGQAIRLQPPEQALAFTEQHEKTLFSQLPKLELERLGEDLTEVGRRLYRQRQPQRALDLLRKALHYKEGQVLAHQTLAQLYKELGDAGKAQFHQKRYAELFNDGGR